MLPTHWHTCSNSYSRLVEGRDRALFEASGLSKETQTWLRGLQAASLTELAQAVVAQPRVTLEMAPEAAWILPELGVMIKGSTWPVGCPDYDPVHLKHRKTLVRCLVVARPASYSNMEYLWDMRKQILVVDDEAEILALLSIMFRRVGYSVLKAENAHKALHMLDTLTPDLFILDVMMPEMDGIELCRRIRARPATAQTPVVLFSASADPIMMQRGLEAGANEFLSKIAAHTELVKKVRYMLDDRSKCRSI